METDQQQLGARPGSHGPFATWPLNLTGHGRVDVAAAVQQQGLSHQARRDGASLTRRGARACRRLARGSPGAACKASWWYGRYLTPAGTRLPRMKITRIPIILAFGVLFLAVNGCNRAAHPIYGGTPEQATVPADFPQYPGALATTQIYGWPPKADGSKDRREREDVTWATDDDGRKIFSYYMGELAKGDWVIQNATADANRGA